MKLKVLSSESAGNCYILENDTSALIIEAGVSLTKLKQALNFNTEKVVGCIISHEHGDHAGNLKQYAAAGIDIYTSHGTLEHFGLHLHTSHRLHEINAKQATKIGEFTVIPFDVKRDAKQPFGFVIKHRECGNVLFVTDTHFIPFVFPGLNQILIEANYDEEILNKKVLDGNILPVVRKRIMTSHMSINICKKALLANDLSKVVNIVLIHLSSGNSNAKQFKSVIQSAPGKNVTVADKDIEIGFNLTSF